MAKSYETAIEAQDLAEQTAIPQWHKELEKAKVAYVFTDLQAQKGRLVLGKTRKATPFERYIAGYDLVISFDKSHWKKLGPAQRIALVDHELCHVTRNHETGDYRLIGHDLEEFNEVVRRHGAWAADIVAFNEAQGMLDLGAPDTAQAERPDNGRGETPPPGARMAAKPNEKLIGRVVPLTGKDRAAGETDDRAPF